MSSDHTTPTSTSLTLRFKRHKSTTILHAAPQAPFSALKAELLRALRQTHPSGYLPLPTADPAAAGIPIPTDPADVLLARPRDALDPSAGWTLLVTRAEEGALAVADGGGGGEARVCETPKAAGLKDGAVLAFRFRGEEGPRERRREADVDEGLGLDEDEQDEEDDGGEGGGEWDVVLPSYEDAAGVVNEGDVGALRNYNG